MTKSDAYMLFTISLNHFNQTTRQLEELDTIAYHTIIIKQSYSHLNYDYDKHFNKCKNIYDKCVKKQTDIETTIDDIAIKNDTSQNTETLLTLQTMEFRMLVKKFNKSINAFDEWFKNNTNCTNTTNWLEHHPESYIRQQLQR